MSEAGVVIVYRDALFGQGLASLLREDGAVPVLDVLAGETAAAERVRALEPALVILEGDRLEGNDRSLLEHLLEAAPCVVEVGLDREVVAIHRRTHVGHSSRFVNLVTRLARRSYPGSKGEDA